MTLKINFTKAALDDLVCPAGKAEMNVYDTDTKGLFVRVTKAGGKTFYVARTVNQKDHKEKIEVYNSKTSKIPAIRNKAQEIYANFESIIEEKKAKSFRDSVTLEKAFEDFIQTKSNLTQSTVKDYRKTFKYLHKYATEPLVDIGNEQVITIHKEVTAPVIQKNGKIGKPRERSANKTLTLLGSIFSFAIIYYLEGRKRVFDHNPVDLLTTIGTWHKNKRSNIRINPVELPQFISECLSIADTPPQRNVATSLKCTSAAVLFMLFTGVRPDEVSKIKKEYVDHKTRSIIFPARTADNERDTLKNGKEFHLVLNDSAYCQILYAMKHSTSEYVFSGVRRQRLGESNARDFLARIEVKTGKHMPRKIMRASFISTATSIELSDFYIKLLCNHDGHAKDVDVTDGYKTAYLEEVRSATTQVEDQIYGLSNTDKGLVCRGLLDTLTPLDNKTMKMKMVHLQV